MIGGSERLVLFSVFYILLHVNRPSVVIAWTLFLGHTIQSWLTELANRNRII